MSLAAEPYISPVPTWRFAFVGRVLGCFLLATAALKLSHFGNIPLIGESFFESRMAAMIAVAIELMLASWLFWGRFSLLAWSSAVAVFCGFGSVALLLGVNGRSDCGCLGAVRVSPWVSMAIDVGIIVLLLFSKPRAGRGTMIRRRDVVIIASLASIVLIVIVTIGWFYFPRNTKSLAVDTDTFDFGEINPNDLAQLTHDFILENKSDRPVAVRDVSTSCGCTVAELPNRLLAPSAQIPLRVRADWQGRVGMVRSEIWVRTDEPGTSGLVLIIKGFVKVEAAVSPRALNFGLLRAGEQATRICTVGGSGTPKFQIRAIRTSDPRLIVRRIGIDHIPVDGPLAGAPGEFLVCFSAQSESEHFVGEIQFETDIPNMALLTASVTADCQGITDLSPAKVLFSPESSGDCIREVTIRTQKGVYVKPELIAGENATGCFRILAVRRESFGVADDAITVKILYTPTSHNTQLTRASLLVNIDGRKSLATLLGLPR